MSLDEVQQRGTAAGRLYARAVAAMFDHMAGLGTTIGVEDAAQTFIDVAETTHNETLAGTAGELRAIGFSQPQIECFADAARTAFHERIGELLLVAPAGSPVAGHS